MPLKKYKPFTPSSRYKLLPDYSEISSTSPEKSLLRKLKKTGGRNNQGRITCRHMGGGSKRKYRLVDFKRRKTGMFAKVLSIEYDPNRTCYIALIQYEDQQKSYILVPYGLKVGMKVISGDNVSPDIGNAMPLLQVPLGMAIHNIEMTPGAGGKVARSAGQQAILSNREGEDALVQMPSGEIRKFNIHCYCSIGQLGNRDHMNEISGKAGRTRWRGIRPTVRGMCMNPVDHPNGGGEGKSKSGGGRQHLKSPWGHVKGQKTRSKHNRSNSFIIRRRKSSK